MHWSTLLQLQCLVLLATCVSPWSFARARRSAAAAMTGLAILQAPSIVAPTSDSHAATLDALMRVQPVRAAETMASLLLSAAGEASSEALAAEPMRGFQTKSGLKYFDLVEGTTGLSPRYGQLVSFYYTTYYKPVGETTKLDFIDSSYVSGKHPFLHKHGNGRIVRGIDEGLHTMKVGGKRRLIVPKAIGYTELGIGPLPEDGGRRRKLGSLLDLLDKEQGELVFDVELVLVADDENDQGYYEDTAVSQEEVRQLVLKSLQTGTDENFIEKLRQTTPPELFKK